MYYLIACGRWYQRDQKVRSKNHATGEDEPIAMHTAIEVFRATDLVDWRGPFRGGICFLRYQLHWRHSGFEQLWMNDEGLEVLAESGESAEGDLSKLQPG